MAFGGGGFDYAKQEPFVEFPEIDLPTGDPVKEERALIVGNLKLLKHWKSSAYYLEESNFTKKSRSTNIERFSDRGKPKTTAKRDALTNYLLLEPTNFPEELITGTKWEQPNPKKVRWNPNSVLINLKKCDLFEKLEEKYQEKGETEKKEGDDEEEDEDVESLEAEEENSENDYNQNIDFDDDDDGFNDVDDGNDHEPEID